MANTNFNQSYVVACFTTRYVIDGSKPILLVTHDEDDGSWQFLCGTTSASKDCKLICLKEAVKIDPTVAELADLPLGWQARRDRPGAGWVREPSDNNGDGQGMPQMMLDVMVSWDLDLFDAPVLTSVKRALDRLAPRWTSRLRAGPVDDRPVLDEADDDCLRKAVVHNRETITPFYRELERRFGRASPRDSGGEWFIGATRDIEVGVSASRRIMQPMGNQAIWGNRLAVQIRRKKVEGVPAAQWAADFVRTICASTSPCYVRAFVLDEFRHQNQDAGSNRVLGADLYRAIPGLYWLNFFGKRYEGFLGRAALLAAPAPIVEPFDDGVLIGLDEDPEAWSTSGYAAVQRAVLACLGGQYFYSKEMGYPEKAIPLGIDVERRRTNGL